MAALARFLLTNAAAFTMSLTLPMEAVAQDPAFFYCYAPDPASGTVYVSSVQSVGPISERSAYGRDFGAYLRSRGILTSAVQAYCTMRHSRAESERAQHALMTEPCSECGGATRFAHVEWARNTPPSTPKNATAVGIDPKPATVESPSVATQLPTRASAADDSQPTLVVLGNGETGALLVERSGADPLQAAMQKARALHPTGWDVLLATQAGGFGAAMCVKHLDQVRFFVAHGASGIQQAISAAREEGQAYATATGEEMYLCGRPWVGRQPLIDAPEPTLMDDVIDTTRSLFVCRSHPEEGAQASSTSSQDKERDERKTDEAARCKMRPENKGTAVGVRG